MTTRCCVCFLLVTAFAGSTAVPKRSAAMPEFRAEEACGEYTCGRLANPHRIVSCTCGSEDTQRWFPIVRLDENGDFVLLPNGNPKSRNSRGITSIRILSWIAILRTVRLHFGAQVRE